MTPRSVPGTSPAVPLRLSCLVPGMDATQPEGIAIGTPLQADFLEQQEGEETRTVLVFHPAA